MYNNIKVLLVGTGNMSIEYSKVLEEINVSYSVCGRSEEKARLFEEKTGVTPSTGGLVKFISENDLSVYTHAIIAVSVESLKESCLLLLNTGLKNILLEKPGGVDISEIKQVSLLANEKDATVLLAYNRRFYASVIKAQQIIQDDRGVESFNFEFTEWGHQLADKPKGPGVKEAWFMVNSSHVADTAFYLSGKPQKISCYTAKPGGWHPSALIFAGAGIAEGGSLFSYNAHWSAPGRWSLDVLTAKHRLIFKPMEELQIQKIGSVKIEPVEVDYTLDKNFKPGLYLQVKNWLDSNLNNFCSIHHQLEMMVWYNKMANYHSDTSDN